MLYLFDLDGTLVYTDPLHFDLWKAILSFYGIELTESMYSTRIRGKDDLSIWQEFDIGTTDERTHWNQWKELEFEKRVMETLPVKGGKEFIERKVKEECLVGVVTNSNQKTATLLLNRLGITSLLNILITSDQCTEPKPSPAPYLTAMNALGVSADNTVIFEDSSVGIRSALAANPRQLYVIQKKRTVSDKIIYIPDYT